MTERRRPRPSAEVQSLIIQAARDLFSQRGYRGTTTRDIAIRAGVAEGLLYRHFRTKSGLFEVAILEPIGAFFADFIQDWRHELTRLVSNDELVRIFTTSLFALLTEQRKLVMALLDADAYEDFQLSAADSPLSKHIDELVQMAKTELHFRGWGDLDLEVVTRITIGTVLGLALLDPYLFPSTGRRHPDRERFLESLIQYQLHMFGQADLEKKNGKTNAIVPSKPTRSKR